MAKIVTKDKSFVVFWIIGGPEMGSRECPKTSEKTTHHCWDSYSKVKTIDFRVINLPFYRNQCCKLVMPRCTFTVHFLPGVAWRVPPPSTHPGCFIAQPEFKEEQANSEIPSYLPSFEYVCLKMRSEWNSKTGGWTLRASVKQWNSPGVTAERS